jgi:cytochrome P450
MTEVADPTTKDEVFPLERTCPFAPPAAYERLREAGPVQRVELQSGQEAWAITRLEDVRQMLTDPRFSSDRFNPGFPFLTKQGRPVRRTNFTASLINMDPPQHGAARREVVGEFTVKRMKALQPRIQQIL